MFLLIYLLLIWFWNTVYAPLVSLLMFCFIGCIPRVAFNKIGYTVRCWFIDLIVSKFVEICRFQGCFHCIDVVLIFVWVFVIDFGLLQYLGYPLYDFCIVARKSAITCCCLPREVDGTWFVFVLTVAHATLLIVVVRLDYG